MVPKQKIFRETFISKTALLHPIILSDFFCFFDHFFVDLRDVATLYKTANPNDKTPLSFSRF